MPVPPPGDLLDPCKLNASLLYLLHWQVNSSTTELLGKLNYMVTLSPKAKRQLKQKHVKESNVIITIKI